MTDTPEQTTEATALAEAKMRQWQTKKALQAAPELAAYLRSLIARQERGEVLDELTAPLRLQILEDADELYARLIEWVTFWHRLMETMPPATTAVAWRNIFDSHNSIDNVDATVIGFKAGVTPRGARDLVQLQTMWLLQRQHRIRLHPDHEAYEADIRELIGNMRGKYPIESRSEKPTYSRGCPLCGEYMVSAEWWSETASDVEVTCHNCGWEIPPKYYTRMLEFIEEPTETRELPTKSVRFTMPSRKGEIHQVAPTIQQITLGDGTGDRYALVLDETATADFKTELIIKPAEENPS